MQKAEIKFKGAEYSAYYEEWTDYEKEKEANCLTCGNKTTYSPVKKIELRELYNAFKMIPINLNSERAEKIAKKIRKNINENRKYCHRCIVARLKNL